MAVLIANDRLPRKSEKVHRYQADRPALEARTQVLEPGPTGFDGPVIDGDVLDERDVTPGAQDVRRAG
jgi:hypothetical protein